MIDDFVSSVGSAIPGIIDWFIYFISYVFSNPLMAMPVVFALTMMIVSVFRHIINFAKGGSLRE